MVKHVPAPGADWTLISPPCAWTMVCTIASPRPVVPVARVREASPL
jgi:hypothetical protein